MTSFSVGQCQCVVLQFTPDPWSVRITIAWCAYTTPWSRRPLAVTGVFRRLSYNVSLRYKAFNLCADDVINYPCHSYIERLPTL